MAAEDRDRHDEDERDLRDAERAYERWLEDPRTIPHEELAAEVGLRQPR